MAPVVADDIVIPPKDAEELALEKLVFGDMDGFANNLKKIDNLYEYSSDDDDNESSSGVDGSDAEEEQLEALEDDQLFFVDDGEENGEDEEEAEAAMDVDTEESEEGEKMDFLSSDSDNAWTDSDDENINISLNQTDRMKKLRLAEQESVVSGKSYIKRLRSQFEKIYPRPQWADEIDIEEEGEEVGSDWDEDTDELKTNALLKFLETNESHQSSGKKSFKLLPPQKLDITRLKDANARHPAKSAIQTMSFHPEQPLLLTGGYDRSLRVYHIDGKSNPLVTSLHLRNSPIQTAAFQNSNKVFAGGRRKFMYKWDIITGELTKISRLYGHEKTQRSFENFKVSPNGAYLGLIGNSGWVNVLHGATGQWIKGFKVEGTLVDIDFSGDPQEDPAKTTLVAVNAQGDVWEWAVASNKILRKWRDDSGVGITKVKLCNRFIAIGNNVGIVNVYDRNVASGTVANPVAVIENLVSTISTLQFSPDAQILAIASRAKKDALRLVHVPSFKVFSNWPTSGTPLGRVTSVCFSNDGSMVCVGNEQGKVRLWRLNHY